MARRSPVDPAEPPAIAAGLFKTTMCRQHATTGKCKYVFRCMFAHGVSDMRTVEQNRADGLVTLAAIAAFKAAQYERKHGHPPPPSPARRSTASQSTVGTPTSPNPVPSPTQVVPLRRPQPAVNARTYLSNLPGYDYRYRHFPYAPLPLPTQSS